MEKFRHYLGEATRCRTEAESVPDPAVRKELLKLAETWDRLADSRKWLLLHKRRVQIRQPIVLDAKLGADRPRPL